MTLMKKRALHCGYCLSQKQMLDIYVDLLKSRNKRVSSFIYADFNIFYGQVKVRRRST